MQTAKIGEEVGSFIEGSEAWVFKVSCLDLSYADDAGDFSFLVTMKRHSVKKKIYLVPRILVSISFCECCSLLPLFAECCLRGLEKIE